MTTEEGTKIESSTDGLVWTPLVDMERPPDGTLLKFSGGVLNSIHDCIHEGILDPQDIARHCGLPEWSLENLLTEEDDSGAQGDYAKLRQEWVYACQVQAYMEYAGIGALDITEMEPQ